MRWTLLRPESSLRSDVTPSRRPRKTSGYEKSTDEPMPNLPRVADR